MRTTSHNHSPKQAHTSDEVGKPANVSQTFHQRERKKKVVCIIGGESKKVVCSCIGLLLNFWGMFVRVYPRIVQGLTFLNSVKHITKNTLLVVQVDAFIVESIGCYI